MPVVALARDSVGRGPADRSRACDHQVGVAPGVASDIRRAVHRATAYLRAVSGGETILVIRRPFNWGGVLVMDSETDDIPTRFGRSGVVRSPTCFGFVVRHAQDVDVGQPPFEVSIDVRLGNPPTGVSLRHHINLPSGVVSIGDADTEESISLKGSCIVSVARDHDDHAEHVTIWITPEE